MAEQLPTSSARVDQDTLLGVLWAGVALSLTCVVFRVYVRIKVFRKLSTDDYFVFLAWLLALVNAAIWQARAKQLYLGISLSSGQTRVFPLDLPDQIEKFLRAILAAYLVQFTALWCVKLSFLFFFRGLGRNIRVQRIIWWSTLAFLISSYAVCIGTVDYRCLAAGFTQSITICYRPSTVRFEYVTLRLTTALDVLTDAAIIGLSTNILWRIQIDWRKKLALVGICSLTSFIIAVAIARVVVATADSNLDLTFHLLWGGVELTVAIIVACLASFRALFVRSDKSHPSAKKLHNHGTKGKQSYVSDGIPLKNGALQNTVTITGDPQTWNSPTSSVSSENQSRGVYGVHVRRDFDVYPGTETV